MKKLLTTLTVTLSLMSTMSSQAQPAPGAVFADKFNTVHSTAPFSKISNADYEPAIDRGIEMAKAEIDAIANNPDAPTFENTVVALDRSGQQLNKVLNIFFPILSADADDELMEISMRVTPKLSDYSTSSSSTRTSGSASSRSMTTAPRSPSPPSSRCSSMRHTTISPSPEPTSRGTTAKSSARFPLSFQSSPPSSTECAQRAQHL